MTQRITETQAPALKPAPARAPRALEAPAPPVAKAPAVSADQSGIDPHARAVAAGGDSAARLTAAATPATAKAFGASLATLKAKKAPADAMVATETGANAPVTDMKDPKLAAFNKVDRQNRAEVAKRIKADPEIQKDLARYEKLKPEEKLKLGERISKHMGDVYGFTPAPMSLGTNKELEGADGSYDDEDHDIKLNRSKTGTKKDFIDTVTHEQGHHYQYTLAKAYREGKLTDADPRFEAAKAFNHNDRKGNYHEAPDDGVKNYKAKYKKYREQPVEAHAFATGAGIAALVLAK